MSVCNRTNLLSFSSQNLHVCSSTPNSPRQSDKKRVKVRVRLPADWEECTVIPPGRSIENIDFEQIVKLTDYPNNELPVQNVFSALDTVGKNDMADLTHLHEAAILYNLKARHREGNPYTRVGDIMVALNPFQVRTFHVNCAYSHKNLVNLSFLLFKLSTVD